MFINLRNFVQGVPFYLGVVTVPTRKTRFFTAHFTKLAVTPMVSEIPKRNVPHLKDLKPGFRFQLKTFRKLQG